MGRANERLVAVSVCRVSWALHMATVFRKHNAMIEEEAAF